MEASKSKTPFTLLGLVAILVWSTAVAVSSSAGTRLGFFTAAACVYLTASTVLLGLLASRSNLRQEIAKLDPQAFCISGVFFVTNLLFFWLALRQVTTAAQVPEIGVVNYLWCTFVLLFAIPILGLKVRSWFLIGILISMIGVVIPIVEVQGISLAGFSENLRSNPLAYLYSLIAAVGWGLYSNLTKRFEAGLNSSAVALTLFVVGLIFLVIGGILEEPRNWAVQPCLEVLFLGAGDALAYGGWDLAMRRGNRMFVASAAYFTPVISTVVTGLYLGAPLGIAVWIGAGMVAVGAVVCNRAVVGQRD